MYPRGQDERLRGLHLWSCGPCFFSFLNGQLFNLRLGYCYVQFKKQTELLTATTLGRVLLTRKVQRPCQKDAYQKTGSVEQPIELLCGLT